MFRDRRGQSVHLTFEVIAERGNVELGRRIAIAYCKADAEYDGWMAMVKAGQVDIYDETVTLRAERVEIFRA